MKPVKRPFNPWADFQYAAILAFLLCGTFYVVRVFVPRISWIPQTGPVADALNVAVTWIIAPGNFFLKFLGHPIIQGEKFSRLALVISFCIFYSATLVLLWVFGLRKPSNLEPKIPFEEYE